MPSQCLVRRGRPFWSCLALVETWTRLARENICTRFDSKLEDLEVVLVYRASCLACWSISCSNNPKAARSANFSQELSRICLLHLLTTSCCHLRHPVTPFVVLVFKVAPCQKMREMLWGLVPECVHKKSLPLCALLARNPMNPHLIPFDFATSLFMWTLGFKTLTQTTVNFCQSIGHGSCLRVCWWVKGSLKGALLIVHWSPVRLLQFFASFRFA